MEMMAKPPPPPRARARTRQEMERVDWAVNLPENRGHSRLRSIESGARRANRSLRVRPSRPSLFTIFSHEYSIEADRQTVRSGRARSQRSIWAHKYSRFVVAANQGLIRLLSLLSSRPLERKMTEKVCFPSLFSPDLPFLMTLQEMGEEDK